MDLVGGFFDIEQREDAAWDESARVLAAPLINVPVVIGLDHYLVQVVIGSPVEYLPGESRKVWKVQARELAAGIHVPHSFVNVITARSHFVVAAGVDVEEFRGLAGHSVETQIATFDIAVPPLLDSELVGSNFGRPIKVFRRDVVLEHILGLGNMVVDTDQYQVIRAHLGPPYVIG
jgi:hypothetical protein